MEAVGLDGGGVEGWMEAALGSRAWMAGDGGGGGARAASGLDGGAGWRGLLNGRGWTDGGP